MDVSVIFNADTAQYEANLAGLDKKTAATAQKIAEAKNKILEYNNQQIKSAQDLGKSYGELEAIQTRTAKSLDKVSEATAAKMLSSTEKQIDAHRRWREELSRLPKIQESHEIGAKQAASATVRGLENGNPGIRSVENFLTTIPGVGKAMQAIFPLIGGAALAGVFIEGAKAVVEFDQKMKDARTTIRDAYAEIAQSARKAGVELDLTGDKLDNAIAKLEHQPENFLKLALDEDRKAASALTSELISSGKAMDSLFNEQGVSFGQMVASTILADLKRGLNSLLFPGAKALFGKDETRPHMSTDDDKKFAHDVNRTVRKASEEAQDALDAVAPDDAKAAKAAKAAGKFKVMNALADAIQQAESHVNGINRLQQQHPNLDYSERLDLSSDTLDDLRRQQRNTQKGFSNADKQVHLERLERQKADKAEGEKIAEKRLRALEAEAAALELNGATPKSIYDFWNRNRQAFTTGSEQFNRVIEKQASIAKSAAEKMAHAIAEARAGNTVAAMDMLTGRKEPKADEGPAALEAGRRAAAKMGGDFAHAGDIASDSQAELTAMNAKAKAQAEELRLNEEAGQSISHLDALRRISVLHQVGFAAELDRLDAKRNQVANATYLDEIQRQEQLKTIDQQRASLKIQADASAQRDRSKIDQPDSSGLVGAKDAIDEFTRAALDNATLMKETVSSSLGAINRTILDEMTGRGQRGQWKEVGRGIASNAAGALLNRAEGTILSAFGKPDGSSSNPLNVKIVDGLGGMGASGSLSGLGKLLFPKLAGSGDPSDSSDSGSGVSGFFGKAIGFVGSIFGGHRALGGNVQAGMTYDVGEMGRETFVAPANGTIVPNSRLGDGTAHYAIQVANGVTPEQMAVHVRQALQEFHPHVVRSSVAAMQERSFRNPASHR
jgi:hypothetical protein